MAKLKSEQQVIFSGEGLLNSTDLVLEADGEDIDLEAILESMDGKFVKISITASESIDIPTVKDRQEN